MSKIAAKGKKKVVTFGDQTKEVETVLVAVGRAPYTEGLGLDKAGVAMEKGFVEVSGFSNREDAIATAKEMPIPEGEYVEGSFDVIEGDIEEI